MELDNLLNIIIIVLFFIIIYKYFNLNEKKKIESDIETNIVNDSESDIESNDNIENNKTINDDKTINDNKIIENNKITENNKTIENYINEDIVHIKNRCPETNLYENFELYNNNMFNLCNINNKDKISCNQSLLCNWDDNINKCEYKSFIPKII